MHHFKVSFFLLTLIIAAGCANQKPPTGGEKDKEPPELISSTPAQEQLNFSGDEIELEFNEAIQLKNSKEQIIITPRIDEEFEIKYKKDRVIIELKAPLADSTTYTFNFREAIQDLNEGNPAENLKLAFSTGAYLDSLQISGVITDLLSNKLLENITVSLFPVNDTINPFEHAPTYFTKTNKEGYYQFDNLKSGNYSILAYDDKNKNLYIESKSESYGFIQNKISLVESIDSLHIPIQHLDIRPLELQGSRQVATTFNLKFNKYLSDYQLITYDSTSLISNYTDKSQSTIQIYNHSVADSLLTFVNAYDTLNTPLRDTVYVKFEPTSRSAKEFKSNLNLEKIVPEVGQLNAKVIFSKPVLNINYDSAFIFLDSLNVLPLDSSHISFTKQRDELHITYVLDQSLFSKVEQSVSENTAALGAKGGKPSKSTLTDSTSTSIKSDGAQKKAANKSSTSPYLYFGPNTFVSIESDSTSRLKADLKFSKISDLAILHVEVESELSSYIVQLLTKSGEVAQEVSHTSKFQFKHIPPGEYRLRVLLDTNNNGQWDPGNYFQNTEPEPVFFYKNSEDQEVITFRANWEVGPYILRF